MKLPVPGALLASLVSACAAGRVSGPPAPPAFQAPPAAARSAASAPAAPAPAAPTTAAPTTAKSGAALVDTSATVPPAGAAARDPSAPAAAQDPAQAKDGAAGAAPDDPPLGWIAGSRLEPEQLLLEWGDIAPREFFLVLDKLVATRLALAEAARLGIRLAPEAVEQRYAQEKKKLEDDIAHSKRARPLDEFIRRELGFEPERYLERVRTATIRRMLAERAVRANSLASETVSVRLIVVDGADDVKKVQDALAAGRDFGDVAHEFSVDDSKDQGGLVPFVVRQERSPFASLAFNTPVGQVAGPLPIADKQFLIRVEAKRAPLEGDWPEVEAKVEASLVENPVEDSEFVHWKLQMEGRYPIDLRPLLNLVGAAK